MKKVIIYTDGACSRNPGNGGWGCVLMYGQHIKELSGFVPDTTNNRMELHAAIQALGGLKEPCTVELYTDSAYLCNAFQLGWLKQWIRRGWKTAANKPVENEDLWRELLELTGKHNVSFQKTKGHADDPWNNRCDQLARGAVKAHREELIEDAASSTDHTKASDDQTLDNTVKSSKESEKM